MTKIIHDIDPHYLGVLEMNDVEFIKHYNSYNAKGKRVLAKGLFNIAKRYVVADKE